MKTNIPKTSVDHTVITGDRPTGPLHLGHYVGSLQSRVFLQDRYKIYVMIADIQALTDNFEHPKRIRENTYELVRDYLAVGIDPAKTTIFVQSQIHEISELMTYYLNLVTLSRLERNPTVKTEIQQKNFGESIPTGFLCYPVSQAADITIVKGTLVPVGEDQLPLLELTNEVVRKFNRLYSTDCLKECEAYLTKTPRLIGIDGGAKAGKSLGNAIFLSDTPALIKEKVFSMFTDPDHIRVSDPGKIEGNVVFEYLRAFYADQEELQSLENQYRQGGLGDMSLKHLLNDTLQAFLTPIRERRDSVSRQFVQEILQNGIERTRNIAKNTIEEVRNVLGLDYIK